jgi:hypothetical protein
MQDEPVLTPESAGPGSGAAAARELAEEQDADLREALAGLSRVVMDQGELAALLEHVANFAVHAIPGADGAGLMLRDATGRPETVVASAGFVAEVDAIQYGIGEGPCISAAATGHVGVSGSLGGEKQWPRFGPRASRIGVHSALSLPLAVVSTSTASPAAIGALNVYAYAKDAFGRRAVELGELFAIPAAISVQNARKLDQAWRLAAQLETALGSRATIDRAVGIVMSRSGCTPEEGFDRLRSLSQRENRKLSVIAEQIVDDAVRRARARHSD